MIPNLIQFPIDSCIKKSWVGVPIVAQQIRIQLVSMRMRVWSLASLSELGIQHCLNCGIGHRHGLDMALLWLWCRLAAVAPIQPLAWELPGPKKKKKKKPEEHCSIFHPSIHPSIHPKCIEHLLCTRYWFYCSEKERKIYSGMSS